GLAAIIYAFEFRTPRVSIPLGSLGPFAAGDLAQQGWRAFTSGLRTHDVRWILIKLPTWTALATLLAVAAAYLRGVSYGRERVHSGSTSGAAADGG
ncbi:MAG TPA: hypothetical protein VJP76_01590, partial [Candidatus Tumulicola sp.]|nr:hypothetical protein [Candidatus Tumulicola sp.]